MNYAMLLGRSRRRTPPPEITITSQPQNVSSSFEPVISEFTASLPSPTGLWMSRANRAGDYFFALGDDADKDFLATASWEPSDATPSLSFTRRTDVVGTDTSPWREVLHDGGSVYATTAGTRLAVSSNGGTSWSSSTGSPQVFFGGGLFVRASTAGIETSTNAATWTQVSAVSISGSISFGYADGAWFLGTTSTSSSDRGIYASADGATWTRIWGGYVDLIESATTFGNSWYIGTDEGPIVKTTDLASATFASGIGPLYSNGSQVAATGQAIVAYAHNGDNTINPISGNFSGALYYSPDGATWTKATLPIAFQTQRRGTLFAAANRFFLFLGASGGGERRYLVGSPDGTEWEAFTSSADALSTRLKPTTRSYASVLNNGVSRPREYTFLCDTNTTNQFRGFQIYQKRPNATFSVSASLSGSQLSYNWQVLSGGNWTDIATLTSSPYTGSQTTTLTVREPTTTLNGLQYRCVVSATGAESVITDTATLTVA